jgi:acyl-CoA synthetase (AMP-forming)/AMP-acid ligase II/pimeloyl-ACP methyl ester carboxylesterase/uncharacterized protein YqfB (UPF0267 family)
MLAPFSSSASQNAASSGWRALYPYEGQRLSTPYGKIHYLDEGRGEPVLCVHGNPTWSFYWRRVVERFRGTHRVVAIDHLGCGLSDKPARAPYRLAMHVENLTRLVEHLDLRNVTLVCHDWGGAIGLGMAVACPERIGRIVLTNTAAFRDENMPWRIRMGRVPGVGRLAIQGFNAFARAAIMMASERPDGLPRHVRDGLLAPYDSWANRVAIHRFVDDIPLSVRHPSYAKLTEIEGGLAQLADRPVQLIWGMKDWCFSPHFLDRFASEFFPDASVERIESAGHYVLEDAPERVLDTIDAFLKRTEPVTAEMTQATSHREPPPLKPLSELEPQRASGNVAAFLRATALQMPDATAVAVPSSRDRRNRRNYRTTSFAKLDNDSDRLAAGLLGMGVERGMRLAIMVRPGIDFIALTWAVFKAGAVAVLIDPGMGVPAVLQCLQRVQPDGFLALPAVHRVRRVLSKRFPKARFNVSIGGGPADCVSIEMLRQMILDEPVLADVSEDDPAAIIFTSGSTGPAKGVLYRHRNFITQASEIRDRFDIRPGGRNLAGFPLFALFDAAMGTTTVVPDLNPSRPAKLDPVLVLEAIHDWQCNQAFGSPAIWNKLSRYCERHGLRLPSLRRVLSAGAPVPPDVLGRLRKLMPADGEIHTPYGATEALPVSTIESREILGETAERSRQGAGTCVGTPFDKIDWRVIQPVAGPIASIDEAVECSTGEIGELIVRGPCVTTEYVDNPDATERSKIVDGTGFWHRMGDCGYLDADNRFWFCGRLAERVSTRNGVIETVPLESIIETHPAVYRAALVGIGEPGAQTPVVCVDLLPSYRHLSRPSFEHTALLSELSDLVREHPRGDEVRWFLFPTGFPVDVRHNAKIRRDQLAVWATQTLNQEPLFQRPPQGHRVNGYTPTALAEAELMLLFKKKFFADILSGKKTQTIRLWKRSLVRPDQSAFVPGLGRVRIQSVDPISLDELTEDDARLDGFESLAALRSELRNIYGDELPSDRKVWRVRFRYEGA